YCDGMAALSGIARDPVPVPGVRDHLQPVLSRIFEHQTPPHDEILYRVRDENLASSGERSNPGTYVHRDPADLVVDRLDLAGMKARTHLQAKRSHRLADRQGAPYAAGRAIERSEEAVARGVDLGASVASEHRSDHGVV